MIALNDLGRLHGSIRSELLTAIERVVDSGEFTLGKEVALFERRAASFLGVSQVIGLASGTAALEIALRSLNVQGEEVLTTAFSFAATATAICNAGGAPIFCDIDPHTFQMDVSRALAIAKRRKPKVILPVHLFGEVLDIHPLCDWAAANGAYVVEDAAQSFGSQRQGVLAGTQGDLGCFSFYPTKILGAMGDAGAIATNRADLATRVVQLREPQVNGVSSIGATNSRIDALQAAVLNVKLGYIGDWNQARREIAKRYETGFENQPHIKCPTVSTGGIVHQYALRVPRRDELLARLSQRGIGTRVYYPKTLPSYIGMESAAQECSIAEAVTRDIISLPMHPHLHREEQEYVIDSVLELCDACAGAV